MSIDNHKCSKCGWIDGSAYYRGDYYCRDCHKDVIDHRSLDDVLRDSNPFSDDKKEWWQ